MKKLYCKATSPTLHKTRDMVRCPLLKCLFQKDMSYCLSHFIGCTHRKNFIFLNLKIKSLIKDSKLISNRLLCQQKRLCFHIHKLLLTSSPVPKYKVGKYNWEEQKDIGSWYKTHINYILGILGSIKSM